MNQKGEVHCSLVVGKARVAPLKAVSIPRLELTAALVCAEIGSKVKKELNMKIDQEYFWTDSQVVLGYLNNDAKRFHIFVANRVQKIKNLTDTSQWHHIPTKDNPADTASRGLMLSQLSESSWFTGPDWLWAPDCSVSPPAPTELQPNDPEVRTSLTTKTIPLTLDLNERLSHISRWTTARRVVARILKMRNNTKQSDPTPEEVENAGMVIIKNIQQRYF